MGSGGEGRRFSFHRISPADKPQEFEGRAFISCQSENLSSKYTANCAYARPQFFTGIVHFFEISEPKMHDSFQTFYSAVLRYKNSNAAKKYAQLSGEEMALYLWGLVHGMAGLISRNELALPGDPMEHVRKLLLFEDIL